MNMTHITYALIVLTTFLSMPYAVNSPGHRSTFLVIGNVQLAYQYDAIGSKALAAGDIPGAKAAYEKAVTASPFEEDANLGLGRCLVAENDTAGAEPYYERVIGENTGNYQRLINVLTEYVLELQKAGDIPKAIQYYNKALDNSVSPNNPHQMDTFPADLHADGSDYNANEVTSVVHIMRALNLDWNEQKQILYERQAAIESDPQNAIVQHYQGILFDLATTQSTTPAATTGK